MRTVREMTVQEQDFADQNHELVHEFLRRKRLPTEEYYDVVIFGYLSAVQQYILNPPSGIEFRAMAFRAMNDAVGRDGFHKALPKRAGHTVSLEELDTLCCTTVPDMKQSVHKQVENKILCEMAVKVATRSEIPIIRLLMAGFTVQDAAEHLMITPAAAYSRMKVFRRRARAAIG